MDFLVFSSCRNFASNFLFVLQEVLAMKFNVLVTTYEFVMFDRSKLSRIDWKYIIIDEAQRMKDRDSVLARDLDRYRCQRRLLLTGTPLQVNQILPSVSYTLVERFTSCLHISFVYFILRGSFHGLTMEESCVLVLHEFTPCCS